MNIILSFAFIALFCTDYYIIYNKNAGCDLTEKQRSYILSIKASFTLFFISLYFNYKFFVSGCDIDLYTSKLTGDDNFILYLSVLNIISYLITDCYLGYNKYHKYMCTLSGYTHHIIYTFISILVLYINAGGMYILFMIEELPTFFLSSGNYNKVLRKDNLFGFTFFVTRILYHMYLSWKFSSNYLFAIFGLLSLGVHCYWFKNWFVKYFLKINKNKKDE